MIDLLNSLMPDNYNLLNNFDIAISYASEDKSIAEEIAKGLRNNNINVFYDGFFQDELWGEDLSVILEKILLEKSDFCLMLVSKNYINKFWATQEQHAIARQIAEKRPFILQLKIEDIDVPGIPKTVHYIKFENIDNSLKSIIHKLDYNKLANKKINSKSEVSPSRIRDKIFHDYKNCPIQQLENEILYREMKAEEMKYDFIH